MYFVPTLKLATPPTGFLGEPEFQVLSMLKRLQDTDLRIPTPISKAPNRASS